jgi:adenylate cyclase
METLTAHLPIDRVRALAQGQALPDRVSGSALFADISGFTPLTEALTRELGPQRSSEELTRHLSLVYDALIQTLHRYGGSLISFNGDAITCWFSGDEGVRGAACALAMQRVMQNFTVVELPSGQTLPLAMKIGVATGTARRFVIGDPEIQLLDVLAGALLDDLAEAEHHAQKGEVVLTEAAAKAIGPAAQIQTWREDTALGCRFGVLLQLSVEATLLPWPELSLLALADDQVRPWLLTAVYDRLKSGQGEFLAELRPAIALFMHFSGIDYDHDAAAGVKLDTLLRLAQRTLQQYEAVVLQLIMGDKGSYLYAVFGAPLAHEDDALRAASAALELQTQIAGLGFIREVQIGLSQGRARTGSYGGSERRTYGVLGDEVNLAARLMQAAQPGQILASKVLRQATGAHFVWSELPLIRVKGKAEPVAVFSLIARRAQELNRLPEVRYALPMVGRERELALIDERLTQVIARRGQIVGITGEAGIGKSRLLAEALRHVSERGLLVYSGEGQSYGVNDSYLIWHNIWWSFFNLDPHGTIHEHVAALESQLQQINLQLVGRLPLLGAALNLPLPDNDLTRSFDAKLRKTSLEALLVDCVAARAREAPLLLVLEDCHWMDAVSHDLLEVIGRAIANLPALIIMAYRLPALQRLQAPRVSRLPYFTEIQLGEFTAQEAEQLIGLKLRQFFGEQAAVAPGTVARMMSRAQGNPFYIEELLNYLQDRGIDPQDATALDQLDLPDSLHSLILSRIDQLTESQKITLKVASVFGRLFQAAALWGSFPQLTDQGRVARDLKELCRVELTLVDAEPELTYLFKHIVTQEVSYESLPYATRAVLHEQVAQYLERLYAAQLDQYVDLLAFHYDRSSNEAKRREYLLKAAAAAQQEYANVAAIDYYRRALPLLQDAPQIAARLKLGQVLELTGKWDDANEQYQDALTQAAALGDERARAQCQLAVAELLRKRGSYHEAGQWLRMAQQACEALDDEAGVGQVLHTAGTLAAQQGNYDQARALYEQSLTIRQRLNDQPRIAALLSNLGIVARYQGDSAQARALYEESLRLRREVGDKLMISVSLNNLGNLYLDLNDLARAHGLLEEAVAIRREVGDRMATANSLNNLGNVARAQSDFASAQALYHESLDINRELGERWAIAYLLEDFGGLAALEGQPARALRLVGAAAALREAIGAPLSAAERAKLERLLAPARQAIEPEGQSALEAEGRAWPPERAMDYALSDQP